MAIAVAGTAVGGAKKTVTVDVEKVPLAEVVKQMAEQGVPRLTPDAKDAETEVTFAIAEATRGQAVRWLCRSQRLVAVRTKEGLAIGRPALDEAEMKEYKIARVASTKQRAEALVGFLRRVVLGAYQNRGKGDGGELQPELEITQAEGKLKVLAPKMVQREVLALLKTMVKAAKPMGYEELRVPYEPYELGFLGARGSPPPNLKGKVTLTLSDVPAPEAVWQLTRASKANFFIDPWDDGLAKSKVSLEANDLPVASVGRLVAKALTAERVFFDGATVFVREARKPIYESLVVRVYNVAGNVLGRSIGEEAERRAKALKLPEGLPYSVDLVGDKLLTSMPGEMHRQVAGILQLAENLGRLPGGGRFPRP